MLQYINNFLDNISNWINAISLIVSIVTLITMLRFKHKLRVELEKERFMILSILVDTFISKISLPMQPVPEIRSISGA